MLAAMKHSFAALLDSATQDFYVPTSANAGPLIEPKGGLILQPSPLELIEHFLHQTLEAAALFDACVLKKWGVFCSWISQIIAWRSRTSLLFVDHAIQLQGLFANVGKIPAETALHIQPCCWSPGGQSFATENKLNLKNIIACMEYCAH